jgi:Tfp pilus assembly protein PilF
MQELAKSRRQDRDESQDAIRQALATSRELLAAGRPEAALAACQKALRIDRKSPEAKELKAEIDAAIGAQEKPGDGHETGVFPLGEEEA